MSVELPHRSQVLTLLQEQKRPLHLTKIADRFDVPNTSLPALTAMLEDIALHGDIVALAGRRYQTTGKPDVAISKTVKPRVVERDGILTVHPKGFGFVSGSKTQEPDVFVPVSAMRGALHGDRVRVRVRRKDIQGLEGEIVQIVQRAAQRVSGILHIQKRACFLEPDDERIRGPILLKGFQPHEHQAHEGDVAVVQITQYPERANETPVGELICVLGKPGHLKTEVLKVLVRENIEEEFSHDVLQEAKSFGDAISQEEIKHREDLRNLPFLTIDPKDARDHDDAIYVRLATREEKASHHAAYVAWIAIADVAHYVKPGSSIDEEAKKRSCSIYLPNRAIPMLPRELSSHLCSLLANEDRLCMAVEVYLDEHAHPTHHRFVEGVIRCRAKLSYEDVARALGMIDDAAPSTQAKEYRNDLQTAWNVASVLRKRRMRRGALDLDIPEAKVELNEEGECVNILRTRAEPGIRKAYSLIEEFMLLANEVVAEELAKRNIPTVYRVHGPPDQERIAKFIHVVEMLDLGLEIEDTEDPKLLQKFLKKIADHPQVNVLNSLLLRSMKQATYQVTNIGHFGLASKAYVHFTSPIRRYPDLIVHRAIHALCQNQEISNNESALEFLQESAVLASSSERKVMDIEREVVDLYRVIFMQAHVGDSFEGTVTALVGTGVYVAIDAPFVDVLVRYDSLGREHFKLDELGLSIQAKRSGETIRIGDRMSVRIEEASLQRRTVYASRVTVYKRNKSVAKRDKNVFREDNGDEFRFDSKKTRAKPQKGKHKSVAKQTRKPQHRKR